MIEAQTIPTTVHKEAGFAAFRSRIGNSLGKLRKVLQGQATESDETEIIRILSGQATDADWQSYINRRTLSMTYPVRPTGVFPTTFFGIDQIQASGFMVQEIHRLNDLTDEERAKELLIDARDRARRFGLAFPQG